MTITQINFPNVAIYALHFSFSGGLGQGPCVEQTPPCIGRIIVKICFRVYEREVSIRQVGLDPHKVLSL
jgi:hypothetical protein